jgi:hypothetical protein
MACLISDDSISDVSLCSAYFASYSHISLCVRLDSVQLVCLDITLLNIQNEPQAHSMENNRS